LYWLTRDVNPAVECKDGYYWSRSDEYLHYTLGDEVGDIRYYNIIILLVQDVIIYRGYGRLIVGGSSAIS